MEVVTDRGVLTMDMFSQNIVLYSDRTHSVSWHNWATESLDPCLLNAFATAILDGTPVPISGEDGLRASEVAIAAYLSAERTAPISLPLA